MKIWLVWEQREFEEWEVIAAFYHKETATALAEKKKEALSPGSYTAYGVQLVVVQTT